MFRFAGACKNLVQIAWKLRPLSSWTTNSNTSQHMNNSMKHMKSYAINNYHQSSHPRFSTPRLIRLWALVVKLLVRKHFVTNRFALELLHKVHSLYTPLQQNVEIDYLRRLVFDFCSHADICVTLLASSVLFGLFLLFCYCFVIVNHS